MNWGTLLKELIRAVESELDKEAHYSRLNDYYESNPAIGLPSTYNTIFKDIDSILKECLAPIPLSLRRAQMKQTLLYQGTLITMDQVSILIFSDISYMLIQLICLKI